MFSSAVVLVMPSRTFSSVAVALTATSSLSLEDVSLLLVNVSVVALPTSVSVEGVTSVLHFRYKHYALMTVAGCSEHLTLRNKI